MVVYQVNASLPEEFVNEWREWMIAEHLPEVMNTGCFLTSRIMELIGDSELTVFVIEYVCPSMEILEHYRKNLSPELQSRHFDKFGNSVKTTRAVYTIHHDFAS